MTYLRLFLSCGTIFIIVMASSVDENTKNESNIAVKSCFPDYVIPEESDFILIPYINVDDYDIDAYNIQFKPFIKEQQSKNNFFHGESNTVINIIYLTANMFLNFWKLRITRLWIQVVKRGKEEIQEYWATRLDSESNLFISFKQDLMPGSYVLKIKFFGIMANNMETFVTISYINEEGNERSLIMGNLKEIRNQNVFPCPSETRLIVKLTISVKHREIYTILSNVPPEVRYIIDDGMIWTHFRITSKMTTDFLAITSSDYNCFSTIFANINMWCRRHMMQYMNHAWDTAKNITTYLQYELRSESVNKISQMNQLFLVIPSFQEENIVLNMILGLAVYREADIFYTESDHSTRKMEVMRVIMRKIINQWFGNVQTSVNAGLALFLEAYVIDKVFENSRMMDLFVVQKQHESLHLLSDFNPFQIQTISDINNSYFLSNYFQVPFIIRTLQHLITDEVFWKGICKCINKYVLNSTNLDFWTVMQTALNESYYKDIINFTTIINSWTMPRHCPILMIQHGNSTTVMRFQNFDSDNWPLPVTFTSQSKPDFSTSFRKIIWQNQTLVRTPSNALSMDLKDDDWIIANLQQAGHYRVNYNTENWLKIAKYLNSWNYRNIHVLNRAQIIDDAFHLATEKNLNISIFWSLASYLYLDTDYIAWYPMIKAFEYMSSIFPLPDERVANIKDKIIEILRKLLMWSGYIENSSDDDFSKYLRQELTKWACILGYSKCMKEATKILELYLEDSEKHKVLPWWKEWTYCKGLMSANSTTWNKMMDIWKKKRDNKILEFLACSRNNIIIRKYLVIIASKKHLQDNEDIYSFHSIIAKHARNDYMLDIIITYFLDIKPRQVSIVAAVIDIINHLYSKQQLDKIRQLTWHIKEQNRDYFHEKIKIRLSEIENLMDYLQIVSE